MIEDSETTENTKTSSRRQRPFKNRRDAGRQLAPLLEPLQGSGTVVLALPRGGIPVGFEVASHLGAPLQAFPARKVGAPRQPELGIGAVAPGGMLVLNEQIIRELAIPQKDVELVVARESAELNERLKRYWGEKPTLDLKGRTVILVDDGLATGGTASAALRALRKQGVGKLILAVPICASQTASALTSLADAIVCLLRTDNLSAVGLWYDNFEQTTDEEVDELLAVAAKAMDEPAHHIVVSQPVSVPIGSTSIEGDLTLPDRPLGVVLFAHGSGSSRFSERNRMVAAALNKERFATLLIDLVTPLEEKQGKVNSLKFDIPLLSERLVAAIDWLASYGPTSHLHLGLFGASTGAAAALNAAADRPSRTAAVVSRGGRVDLADESVLVSVTAPTLLIVGELDPFVLELNLRFAHRKTVTLTEVKVVPGASHLFSEPGALETVARLSAEWFTRHLGQH